VSTLLPISVPRWSTVGVVAGLDPDHASRRRVAFAAAFACVDEVCISPLNRSFVRFIDRNQTRHGMAPELVYTFFVMLVMHAARTLQWGTDLNCASIRRYALSTMTLLIVGMLSSWSKLWWPLRPPDPVILLEASRMRRLNVPWRLSLAFCLARSRHMTKSHTVFCSTLSVYCQWRYLYVVVESPNRKLSRTTARSICSRILSGYPLIFHSH